MYLKKVEIYGCYQDGDEQNNGQFRKFYLDYKECRNNLQKEETLKKLDGEFAIDENGTVHKLCSSGVGSFNIAHDFFTEGGVILNLRKKTIYEIYSTDEDGRRNNTISLHSSNALHEIDYERQKNGWNKQTTRNDCFIDKSGNIYEVKNLGIDASKDRDEKEEFRQSLIKTLTPEQLEYLKENPL